MPSTYSVSVAPVKVAAMWCHAPSHTAVGVVSRPSPPMSTITMPQGLLEIQMRNAPRALSEPYDKITPLCAHDVDAEQVTQTATERGAAPEGRGRVAVEGEPRRCEPPMKDMAAPAAPARSGTKNIPGGAGLLKAPTPSLASHERKKTVSAGPVAALGAHVCEDDTNVVMAEHVEQLGEPKNEYSPAGHACRRRIAAGSCGAAGKRCCTALTIRGAAARSTRSRSDRCPMPVDA